MKRNALVWSVIEFVDFDGGRVSIGRFRKVCRGPARRVVRGL